MTDANEKVVPTQGAGPQAQGQRKAQPRRGKRPEAQASGNQNRPEAQASGNQNRPEAKASGNQRPAEKRQANQTGRSQGGRGGQPQAARASAANAAQPAKAANAAQPVKAANAAQPQTQPVKAASAAQPQTQPARAASAAQPQTQPAQAASAAQSQTRTGRRRGGRGAQNSRTAEPAPKIQIIPLGGLGEIGKNMTVIRYEDEMIVVDAGLAFPEEELLGIDIVIPDITFLLENKEKVRGIVLTHGHEDHIGAVPYVLKQLDVPVFGTPLTLGLVEGKLAEHGLVLPEGSRVAHAGETLRIGSFIVDLIRVNHSIPDAVSVALHTPAGTVVVTGDFKFDHTPVDGQPADFHKLAELGQQGVLVLLSDSTNAERPGFTPSERVVAVALDEIIGKAEGRVLVATFASNVHRMQQVITAAEKFNRKVAVVGRSMENTLEIARGLGYLEISESTLIEVEEMGRYPANQLVLLTTGSQGEPMSALTRMSNGDHRRVEIIPGDTVLIAATPVPGNEKMVSRTVNNLYKRGAKVIHPPKMLVHVSGHASQEEQKLMLNLIRPKYFVPVHGEHRMLIHHSQLAEDTGVPRSNILIGDNGTVFEFSRDSAAIVGRATAGLTLVDGLGVGDVGNIVLRDRKQLSQDGILIVVVALDKNSGLVVSGPDVVTRGFVYVRESEALMDEARDRVRDALEDCEERHITEWSTIKSNVRDALGKFLYDKTRRRPMILPVIMEV